MLLYHGTTATIARKALTEGLKPRSITGASNWKHTVESRADCVYLTSTYAGYFALCAHNTNVLLGIVEVETDDLLPFNLLPDEDFLAQGAQYTNDAGLKSTYAALNGDLNLLSAYFRDRLHQYNDWWESSVKFLGNCCYKGSVPASAIRRVAIIHSKKAQHLAGAIIDPTITLMNHRLMGDRYKAMTRYIMGETMTAEDFIKPCSASMFPKEQLDSIACELEEHRGISLLNNKRGLYKTAISKIIKSASVLP